MDGSPEGNAASNRLSAWAAYMNGIGERKVAPGGSSAPNLSTPDYTYEDRRRVVAAPPADRDEMKAQMAAFFQIGGGAPVFSVEEIIDTRGERLALVRAHVTYDQGFIIDMLMMVLVEASLERIERTISFESTDTEVAIRELDETHAALKPSGNIAGSAEGHEPPTSSL